DTGATPVARMRKTWTRSVRRRSLPWYAEEKLRNGAYAALLGFELVGSQSGGSGSGTWHATACGDCCFFQVRGSDLITAFPLTHSDQFSNCPFLLCSIGAKTDDFEYLLSSTGEWIEGDCFYLMT